MRRVLVRAIKDGYRAARQAVRRFVLSPGLTFAYRRFRAAMARHDWPQLRALLRPLAERAKAVGDHRLLVDLSQAASRLDEHQLSAELWHEARRLAGEVPSSTWAGEDIRDATLVICVIETAKQGVAAGLDLAGYIKAAAARAARTIVIVEPRLTALFQRTLLEVTVLPFGSTADRGASGKLVTATKNDLEFVLGHDAATISRLYTPLIPDAAETRTLRERYLAGRALPLIGISWWGSHYGKDLPPLAHWRRLVERVPAQFVSLQYGDIAADVALLRDGDAGRIVTDESVDQLTNMDRFASQIASLDLVITISNSGAHLAGALGKRMLLVRDDLFRRNWPYLSREVPWYPATTVIGMNDRAWDAVFDEIIATAKNLTGL